MNNGTGQTPAGGILEREGSFPGSDYLGLGTEEGGGGGWPNSRNDTCPGQLIAADDGAL